MDSFCRLTSVSRPSVLRQVWGWFWQRRVTCKCVKGIFLKRIDRKTFSCEVFVRYMGLTRDVNPTCFHSGYFASAIPFCTFSTIMEMQFMTGDWNWGFHRHLIYKKVWSYGTWVKWKRQNRNLFQQIKSTNSTQEVILADGLSAILVTKGLLINIFDSAFWLHLYWVEQRNSGMDKSGSGSFIQGGFGGNHEKRGKQN